MHDGTQFEKDGRCITVSRNFIPIIIKLNTHIHKFSQLPCIGQPDPGLIKIFNPGISKLQSKIS